MSKENERVALISKDLPIASSLLENLTVHLKDVSKSVGGIYNRIKEIHSTANGISFLELKLHMMLNYLMNLTQLIIAKTNGVAIEGNDTVNRLIETRIVLERMRPIDQKLKYQVDKLLKMVASGTVDSNDPLQFKANPDNLLSKLDEGDSSSDSDDEKKKSEKQKVYVPPKLVAMHYDGDDAEEDKEKQLIEKARKKVLSSSIMEDLKNEYYEGPEEINESIDLHKKKVEEADRNRLRYEEENFVRLTVSKKELNDSKKVATISSLGNLAKFDNLDIYEQDGEETKLSKKRRKSKESLKFKKSKGGKKRKRFH